MTGDWQLDQADALDWLAARPVGGADAVVTDPPYSSGGAYRGDRACVGTATKYTQSGTAKFAGSTFAGDSKDQRSWAYWCDLWLRLARRVTRPGGYLLSFTDWRQLPALTDAVQSAGWVWRGLIAWDKGLSGRASHPHYYRHQCEYVVWATNGPGGRLAPDWPREGEGMFPGCYRHAAGGADKVHPAGKPTGLMRDLLRCVPPGGLVLDPFAGSGTTGVAAVATGRRFAGCESEAGWAAVARERLAEAAAAVP